MWHDLLLTAANGVITSGGKTPNQLPFEFGLTKLRDKGCCVGSPGVVTFEMKGLHIIPLTQMQNGFLTYKGATVNGARSIAVNPVAVINGDGQSIFGLGNYHSGASDATQDWFSYPNPISFIQPVQINTRGRIDVKSLLDYVASDWPAKKSVNSTGSSNDFTVISVLKGDAGNALTFEMLNPGTPNAALSVTVAGNNVSVHLATNGSSAITSTAQQVMDLINTSPATAGIIRASTIDNALYTGVVAAFARASLSGGLTADSQRLALRSGPLWLWMKPYDGSLVNRVEWSPV